MDRIFFPSVVCVISLRLCLTVLGEDAEQEAKWRAEERKAVMDDAAESMRRHAVLRWGQNAVVKAMPTPTQDEANRYYRMTEGQILARFGAPVLTRFDWDKEKGEYKLLCYEREEGGETFFALPERDGVVCDRLSKLKGVAVLEPEKR